MLLIQSLWPARSLLMAEMEELGLDVLAADSLSLALELSLKRGFSPDVIVVDEPELPDSPPDQERLHFFRGDTPLLVIGFARGRSAGASRLPRCLLLHRPVTIGEIASAVQRLLAA